MQRIELPQPPVRVLIVKPSAIGDVVHALPILDLLKRHWPGAQFSWLVTPACAGILDYHPLLHEVIRFDRKRFGQAWRRPAVLKNSSLLLLCWWGLAQNGTCGHTATIAMRQQVRGHE